MTPAVKATLDVLCAYYSDREGQPRRLNPVQVTVYADGLARFPADRLKAAARAWMRQSKFFPALSDLIGLLEPKADAAALAHLAWAGVESAIRRVGVYGSVEFTHPAVHETVRQVFGTWPNACSFDWDSPGWAIRRQTFLAIFPTIAAREPLPTVPLRGLQRHEVTPIEIAGLESLPMLPAAEDKSAKVLRDVERMFLERQIVRRLPHD